MTPPEELRWIMTLFDCDQETAEALIVMMEWWPRGAEA